MRLYHALVLIDSVGQPTLKFWQIQDKRAAQVGARGASAGPGGGSVRDKGSDVPTGE